MQSDEGPGKALFLRAEGRAPRKRQVRRRSGKRCNLFDRDSACTALRTVVRTPRLPGV